MRSVRVEMMRKRYANIVQRHQETQQFVSRFSSYEDWCQLLDEVDQQSGAALGDVGAGAGAASSASASASASASVESLLALALQKVEALAVDAQVLANDLLAIQPEATEGNVLWGKIKRKMQGRDHSRWINFQCTLVDDTHVQ